MSSSLPPGGSDAGSLHTEPLDIVSAEEPLPDDAAPGSAVDDQGPGGQPSTDRVSDAEADDARSPGDDEASVRPRTGAVGRALGWVAAILLSVVIVLCVVLGLSGYRAYIMQTPSMGTAAPVGSLVVTRPAQVADLHPGDIVTVAPAGGGETHTHRVLSVSDGSATTRGDLNGTPDPEKVVQGNLEGRAVVVAPVLGWATKMLPMVLVVLLVSMLLTARVRDPQRKFRYRALGFFCGVALSVVVVQPLLGVQLLGMRTDQDARGSFAEAHVVSTGLFPVSVSPAEDHGTATDVLAPTGTDGMARADRPSDGGKFTFYPRMEFTPVWWLGAVLYCATPFAVLGLHQWFSRRKEGVPA